MFNVTLNPKQKCQKVSKHLSMKFQITLGYEDRYRGTSKYKKILNKQLTFILEIITKKEITEIGWNNRQNYIAQQIKSHLNLFKTQNQNQSSIRALKIKSSTHGICSKSILVQST